MTWQQEISAIPASIKIPKAASPGAPARIAISGLPFANHQARPERKSHHENAKTSDVAVSAQGTIGGAGFIATGVYNIGADAPHWPLTHKLVEALRERSIAARATQLTVPNLNDPKLLGEGAEHYTAMCSGCHLAPGMEDTEIRAGLYPQPPNLAEHEHGESHDGLDPAAMAARQFWIIKHGIKLTAMPAWGKTHDDDAVWGLVAFLQKLPEMSAAEYAALSETTSAGGHEHGARQEGAQEMDGMKGMGSMDYDSQQKPAPPETSGHIDPPGAKPHHQGEAEEAQGTDENRGHAQQVSRSVACRAAVGEDVEFVSGANLGVDEDRLARRT